MPAIKSIRQIQQELKAARARLGKLQARRGKIARDLRRIDGEIAALAGKQAPAGCPRPKRAAKAAKAPKSAPRVDAPQRGPAAGKPLLAYIKEALAPAQGGLRIKEVMAAVTKAGYASKAKDFYGIVAAAMRGDAFQKLRRGVYCLKGAAAGPAATSPRKTRKAVVQNAAKNALPPSRPAANAKPKAPGKAAKTALARPTRKPGGLQGLLAQLMGGKKAVTVGQAMDAVLAAGYKTKSKAFRTLVNQTLLRGEEFRSVGRGTYALKG